MPGGHATVQGLKTKWADEGDARMAVHALHGIFWALNVLVIQKAADDITDKVSIENGAAVLIVAGEMLADEVSRRL